MSRNSTSKDRAPHRKHSPKTSARESGPRAGVPRSLGGKGIDGSSSGIVSMSSTEAQNGFGHLLETVAKDRIVFIERRNAAKAVVMSVDRYRELTREAEPNLDELTAEFDAMLERMQSPESRAGIRSAFRATPDELAKAAVAAGREGSE